MKVMDGDIWLHLAKDRPDVGLRLVLDFGLWLRQRQSSCWVGVEGALKEGLGCKKRILLGQAHHRGH